jgi:hypothetical protein
MGNSVDTPGPLNERIGAACTEPPTSDTTKGGQAPRADSLKASQPTGRDPLTSSDVTDAPIEVASPKAGALPGLRSPLDRDCS